MRGHPAVQELKPFEMDPAIKSLPGPLVDALVEIPKP